MKLKNRKGSTLVLTMMIFLVLMILSTFVLKLMVTENKQSIHHQNKMQAYYIARGGAEAVEAAILGMNGEDVKSLEKELDDSDKVDVDEIDIDGDKANVTVSKDGDNLVVKSTGYVRDVSEEVTKVLIKDEFYKDVENVAIYAGGDMKIDKYNVKLEDGKVYVRDKNNITLKNDNITLDNDNKLNFSIEEETRHYAPLRSFDKLPHGIRGKMQDATTKDDLSQIIKNNNGEVDILINGDYTLKNLETKESDKVRIFITGNLTIDSNQQIGNDINPIEIFCYGDLTIEHGKHIYADIYVKGNNININTQADKIGFIYAPNSTRYLSSNQEFSGVICDSITMNGNADLHMTRENINIPFGEGYFLDSSGVDTLGYSEGYYKR